MRVISKASLFCIAILMYAAAPLQAVVYLYDFSNPTGNLGSSVHTYTDSGVSITARGYRSANTSVNLYGTNSGSSLKGVGLSNTSNQEISGNGFIQLDITNLKALNATNFMVTINAVSSGDSWKIYGATTQGQLGSTVLASGNTAGAFAILPGNFNIISVAAYTGDILLAALSAQTVAIPEPSTLLILGAGLALAAFGKRFYTSRT